MRTLVRALVRPVLGSAGPPSSHPLAGHWGLVRGLARQNSATQGARWSLIALTHLITGFEYIARRTGKDLQEPARTRKAPCIFAATLVCIWKGAQGPLKNRIAFPRGA